MSGPETAVLRAEQGQRQKNGSTQTSALLYVGEAAYTFWQITFFVHNC
jgi:hypothetical protein